MTAMITDVFASFSAVQLYDLLSIHLHAFLVLISALLSKFILAQELSFATMLLYEFGN